MAEEKKYTFRCTVCGWEVTVDTPELPEDLSPSTPPSCPRTSSARSAASAPTCSSSSRSSSNTDVARGGLLREAAPFFSRAFVRSPLWPQGAWQCCPV